MPPPKPVNANARAVLIDPPSGRAPWPPKDTQRSLEVSRTGWDWGSAAAVYGIPDPLDLIHFNFLTTEPEEVNWYLRNYVGCINSDDGRNFTFAGADPGVIFIPQFGYTRKSPGTTSVEKRALDALWFYIWPYYPEFWHRGVHFSSKSLEILIRKIEDNKVDIIWDTEETTHPKTKKKHAGRWSFKDSAIYLRGTDFLEMADLGTLVHEATHALVDVLTRRHPAVRDYKYVDDELAAYFAKAYWIIESYGLLEAEIEIYEATSRSIYTAALYLAYVAKTKGYRPIVLQSLDDMYENVLEMTPPNDDPPKRKPIFPDPFNPYQTLRKAIATSPTYKSYANDPRKWHRSPVGK